MSKRIYSLQMAGHRVKVVHVQGMEDFGDSDVDERLITLRAGMSAKDYRDTLRHEMRHMALRFGGVAYCESMEEEAVNRCLDNLLEPAWEKVRKRL
jgi:hypothetical protein